MRAGDPFGNEDLSELRKVCAQASEYCRLEWKIVFENETAYDFDLVTTAFDQGHEVGRWFGMGAICYWHEKPGQAGKSPADLLVRLHGYFLATDAGFAKYAELKAARA